jgi:pilus assembly protein CpaC
VIGGLKQSDKVKTIRRVAVLGSIPGLGGLFRHTETSMTERELLIVVSPEVVAGALSALPALPGQTGSKR